MAIEGVNLAKNLGFYLAKAPKNGVPTPKDWKFGKNAGYWTEMLVEVRWKF